jgi:hypothetical protein
MKKIPKCLMTRIWTDLGYEHDCEYPNSDDFPCDDCICVTSDLGDFYGINPKTGKPFTRFPKLRRLIWNIRLKMSHFTKDLKQNQDLNCTQRTTTSKELDRKFLDF